MQERIDRINEQIEDIDERMIIIASMLLSMHNRLDALEDHKAHQDSATKRNRRYGICTDSE